MSKCRSIMDPMKNRMNPQFNSNVVMNVENKKSNDGIYKFVGYVKCRESGQIVYTIRICLKSLFIHPFELGLVLLGINNDLF